MQKLHLKIDDKLAESEKLWRYMDLAKFISLIEEKALWLARSDTFRDKHEGRFPDDMRKAIEIAYESFEDQYKGRRLRDVDAYSAKVLTREEEINIIRACHDRRDWMPPEHSIT